MKTLNFNNEQFRAEKIIRTDTDIIGQDLNGNGIFVFREISDFTGYAVDGGFDIEGKTEIEITTERIQATEEAINIILTML